MTIEELRAAVQKRPFKPFVMHLAAGGAIPVQRPEFFLAAPSGRRLVVVQPDETANILDLVDISHLEFPRIGRTARGRKKS